MQDPENEPKSEIILPTAPDEQPFHKMDKIATIRKIHEDILEADESVDEPTNILDFDPSAVTLSAYAKCENA